MRIPVPTHVVFPVIRGAWRLGILLSLLHPVRVVALITLGAAESAEPPPLPGAAALLRSIAELHSVASPGSLVTAIAPRRFLTAAHLPFGPGDLVIQGEREYRVLSRTNLPGSDLSVGTVDADFPDHVPLYDRRDEVQRGVLVFGKGRWKGEAVRVDGALRGWRYAESGPAGIRWGTNQVARLVDLSEATTDGLTGFLLAAEFNQEAGDHEVHLTYGDSGGPVFLDDCGIWKLAAIASAVDGPFRTTPESQTAEVPFLAALFDAGGLFARSDDGTFHQQSGLFGPVPTSWYASRVAPRVAELRGLAGLPERPESRRLPDTFAWRTNGMETLIPWETLLLHAPASRSSRCTEAWSRGGAAVEVSEAGVVFGRAPKAVQVDSARFVVADSSGSVGDVWGVIYLVDRAAVPVEATGAPSLLFDPVGTRVVLWPGTLETVVAAETAAEVGGPWSVLETAVVRFGGRWCFADDAHADLGRRTYRLRLGSGAGGGLTRR